MSSFLRTGDLSDTGLILRKRRGALTPRFKRGSEEQGDDVVEAAAFGLQADGPQDSIDADASEDEQTNLEEQLEASRETVSGEPSQIMTPAAVWLPYGDRKAAEEATARPPSGFAAALDALLSLPRRLAKWFLFSAQQLMTGPNIIAKLAGYFAVGVPVVLGCAVLYSWVSGKTLVEGFVQAYGNLYKVPGTVVLGDVNIGATILNNITFFLGTFTFALILGIISEEVGERYRRVREGNYPVQTSGHTLILNWNSQLVPLLRQMRVAREERGAFQGSVVVLAEHDKEVMDRQLASALASNQTPSMQVTTRSGPPTSTHYLDRAAAATASTVVVLAPESHADATSAHHDGSAERQVASLLALQALRQTFHGSGASALPRQTVILQSPPAPTASPAALGGSNMPSMDSMGGSVDNASLLASTDEAGGPASPKRRHAHPVLDAARRLMDSSSQPVEFADLDLEGTMANVMAQSAVQPGVASVWCSLVQQTLGGAELYIRSFPQLSELTYGEARRRFSDAVPIGYINFGVNPDVRGHAAAKQAQLQGAEMALYGEQWPQVHLNPPDSNTLLDNSALVLVAKTGGIRPQGWEPQEFVVARQQHGTKATQSLSHTSSESTPQSKPKHVFVLEWGADGESPPSHRVTRVVSALKACLPEDSMISVVGPSAPDVDCSMDSGTSNMPHKMHHFEEGLHDKSIMQSVDADSESSEERQARARREPRKTVHLQYIPAAAGGRDLRRVVEDAGLAGADAAVVLSSSNGSDRGGVEADAHIISALVLLEDVVVRAGRTKRSPLHVLGTVQRPETVQVANHLMGKLGTARITAELLQPDELAAGVLTQMAAEPLLRPVLGAFMSTHRGPTIRLYQAARYALPIGQTLSFASVAEQVRARGETALGYINGAGRMILGPPPAEEHSYGRDDRVVVLACE